MTLPARTSDSTEVVAWLRAEMRRSFSRIGAATDRGTLAGGGSAPAAPSLAAERRGPGILARVFGHRQAPTTVASDRHGDIAAQPDDGRPPSAVAAAPTDPRCREPWRDWPPFAALCAGFALTDDEARVLLLGAAPELDSSFPAFCLDLFGQASVPTFALADQLFRAPVSATTAADRPLRRFQLLEIFQPGGTTLLQSEVHASEWTIDRLRGAGAIDQRLADRSQHLAAETGGPVARSHLPALDTLRRFLDPNRAAIDPVVQLCGPGGDDKRTLVALAGAGTRVFRLRGEGLVLAPRDQELLPMLWEREARLGPLVLLVDLQDVDGTDPSVAGPIRRFVDRCAVPMILTCRDPWRGIDRPVFVVDVPRPRSTEQLDTWTHLLPSDDGTTAGELAGQFDLGLGDIARAVGEAGVVHGVDAGSSEIPLRERLWDACRSANRPVMEGLAERIAVEATLGDLVLPASERGLIDQLMAQVRNRSRVYNDWGIADRTTRGLGITAVFAGESGTGKTLAAEALAGELRLDLYRIDLSAVVDKYVGETEKNIRRLFDCGENGGVVLFFDEADALFGKRTEIKESHDRFANIEINYLLQRIETYRGLVILATNAKSAMDQAFLRRLRFIVNFPFPGASERRGIWDRTIPLAHRADDLSLDRLARLNVAGGTIRNIGLNALFLAAGDGSAQVSMAHARRAAEDEYRKIGRPFTDDLLGVEPAAAGAAAGEAAADDGAGPGSAAAA